MESLINKTISLHCTNLDDLAANEDTAIKDYGLTLLAKIVSSKKSNPKVVQSILLKSWNPSEGMKVQFHHDNIFSILFNHEWDRNRIMKHRPWSVMSSHVVVRDWPQQLNLDEIDFSKSPFWIRVVGLPPNLMTKQNVEKIGSKIGEVTEVDFTSDGKLAWLRYLRIQVQQDISEPLRTGFTRNKDHQQQAWIRLQYERLPDFCFACGRLGHTNRSCPRKPPDPPKNMASPYGPWLRADNMENCPHTACWSPSQMLTLLPAFYPINHYLFHTPQSPLSTDQMRHRGDKPGLAHPPTMIILAWNIRGLGRAERVKALKKDVRNLKPDIIFLSETLSSSSKLSPLFDSLGFLNKCFVPPTGKKPAGGLCLAWKMGVDIEITLQNNNIINGLIFSDPSNQPWMMSMIYGPPHSANKRSFWEDLSSVLSLVLFVWEILMQLWINLKNSEEIQLPLRPMND
ncbi:hypothetical protein RJ639_023543 [Escallonia herrerae]|uniref:CCHC-type domain-containing protein n=1 Tax=Escallonia herrerae TaxID=1293975 RepID=A0AA88UZU3_9ASTE|nr:hypothetical protein RJ639_023543 [Escallonia herrerae]